MTKKNLLNRSFSGMFVFIQNLKGLTLIEEDLAHLPQYNCRQLCYFNGLFHFYPYRDVEGNFLNSLSDMEFQGNGRCQKSPPGDLFSRYDPSGKLVLTGPNRYDPCGKPVLTP